MNVKCSKGHTGYVLIAISSHRGECVIADGEQKSVGWTSPGLVFTSPGLVFTSPRVDKTTPGLVHRVASLRDPVPLRADYWMADVCILWCDLLVRSARHTLVPFHVHFTLIYVFNALKKRFKPSSRPSLRLISIIFRHEWLLHQCFKSVSKFGHMLQP